MEGYTKDSVLKRDSDLGFPSPHALLISASAGTGKTYTLTHRYVQFLLSDAIKDVNGTPTNDIRNLLAITFTRKAAKQMKTKILELLADIAMGKNPEKNRDGMLPLLSLSEVVLREKAAAQLNFILDNYSDFHIQTIDKFMARVMRSAADELGLRPDQEISTDYASLVDTALYAVFSRSDTSIRAQIDNFLQNMPAAGSYKWNPISDMKAIFENFLMQENKLYGTFHLREEGERKAGIKKVFKEVLTLSQSLAAIVPDKVDETTKKIIGKDIEDDVLYQHIEEYRSQLGTHGILCRVRINKEGKLTLDDKALRIKLALDEQISALVELLSASYFNAYIVLYDVFKRHLRQVERSPSMGMHIQQISKMLSDQLNKGTVPEIYLKLGDTLYHYLIDEFQDTDKIQWRNLRALIEESLSQGGSLFMVGDLKQAIYMFRNADYGIMKDLLLAQATRHSKYLSLDSLPNGIEVKDLTINRRSGGHILDYVEDVFQNRLKDYLAREGLVDVTGLTSFPQKVEQEKKDSGFVKIKTVRYGTADEKAAGAKQALLEILKGDGVSGGVISRFLWKDILILVQRNNHIKSVVAWLNEARIPVVSSSSLDIRTRTIIAETIALLQFLDSPVDDLSFAQFIAGNIFAAHHTGNGLAPSAFKQKVTELMHAWRFQGKGYLYTWFQNYPAFSAIWKSDFERLFASVGYKPVYELVSDMYKTFHVFEHFSNESACLVKFLDTVNTLQAEGVHDIKGLLAHARNNGGEDKSAERFSIALPEYTNAVNVMTFHGSKGLERSVIINLISDEKDPTDPLYIHKSDTEDPDVLLYRITKEDTKLSRTLDAIKISRETEEMAQTLNTLYVITTRAKQELYHIVITQKTKETHEKSAS